MNEKAKGSTNKKTQTAIETAVSRRNSRFCSLPKVPPRTLGPEVHGDRAAAILIFGNKWVNITELRYYFFNKDTDGRYLIDEDGKKVWRSWTTDEKQKNVVRKAFAVWKEVGIGLNFVEVQERSEAEIRIGFEKGDGAWSYLGREVLDIDQNERTMNFGWSLKAPGEIDTAIHEIGHTLGLPHEHQNPFSGIEWNEEKVYEALGGPPNNWKNEDTYYNILRKIETNKVQGSAWDPDSVMHYSFEKGLIEKPEIFRNGLFPKPGLSPQDKVWAQAFYPPQEDDSLVQLVPFETQRLAILPGQQKDFVIKPEASRKYTIQTFGKPDTVLVLFEDVNGDLRYRAGDDNSGQDRNAALSDLKLFRDRRYVLRIRLYHQGHSGDTAVMIW